MMISSMRLASHIMTSRVFERYFIETESQDTLSAFCKQSHFVAPFYIILHPSPRMYTCLVRVNNREYASSTGVKFETENEARECAAGVALDRLMGDTIGYCEAV
ncbi:uncharacterized protein LAJ45_00544 [Morchella importuna]|uniref:DRBM domain-containing protein n=1 Tax=Morchella conica CCBAS932 TaxID=1392247 RepID=A0A3N4L4I4_9PEZI|nr:uncharacterized protein LAJ45_00544 [Morchella importuna]KAH8155534.1 hypothetical protein LAJ45_00544 [Morchella importuna]RPB16429.1 hypothetical protein P167DRAFT_602616 [Morchella conica CCBAS932]